MPVPKHRFSKARRRSRAAHFKVFAPTLGACPRCKKPRRPHHVCPNCGRYGERQVVELKDEE